MSQATTTQAPVFVVTEPTGIPFNTFVKMEGITSDRARFHAFLVRTSTNQVQEWDDWTWLYYDAFCQSEDARDEAATQDDALELGRVFTTHPRPEAMTNA